MGWVVNATPWPIFPRELPGTHCNGGSVGPKNRLDRCGKYRPHRDSSPWRIAIPTELSRSTYCTRVQLNCLSCTKTDAEKFQFLIAMPMFLNNSTYSYYPQCV